VLNKPNSTSVIVTNLGYDGNAAVFVVIPAGSQMTAAGLAGVANGGIYAGTQADLAANPPPGPAIWILTDSDPAYQVVPIV
jgi:hypothetical protein